MVRHIEFFVALSEAGDIAKIRLPKKPLAYERLIAGSAKFDWAALDENAACGLCYTSGTTGDPKGVLYSHRSNILLAMMAAQSSGLSMGPKDRLLPAVPMFHANGWGIPFITPMLGASLVLPGPRLDGASLYDLLESERVTLTAGVPTVWLGLLAISGKQQSPKTESSQTRGRWAGPARASLP